MFEKDHKNSEAVLGATGMNRLTSLMKCNFVCVSRAAPYSLYETLIIGTHINDESYCYAISAVIPNTCDNDELLHGRLRDNNELSHVTIQDAIDILWL